MELEWKSTDEIRRSSGETRSDESVLVSVLHPADSSENGTKKSRNETSSSSLSSSTMAEQVRASWIRREIARITCFPSVIPLDKGISLGRD